VGPVQQSAGMGRFGRQVELRRAGLVQAVPGDVAGGCVAHCGDARTRRLCSTAAADHSRVAGSLVGTATEHPGVSKGWHHPMGDANGILQMRWTQNWRLR